MTTPGPNADVTLAKLVALRITLDGIEAERLTRIQELRDLGVTMDRIAEACGLSTDGLYKMWRRRTRGARVRRK